MVRDTEKTSDPDGTPLYNFESLTWVPYDMRIVDANALSVEQGQWLEHYHTQVIEKLSPHLSDEEMAWVKNITDN